MSVLKFKLYCKSGICYSTNVKYTIFLCIAIKKCDIRHLDEISIVPGGVDEDHRLLRAGLELEEYVPAGQPHLKGGQLDDAVRPAEGDHVGEECVTVTLQGSQVEARLLAVKRCSGVAKVERSDRQVFLLLQSESRD